MHCSIFNLKSNSAWIWYWIYGCNTAIVKIINQYIIIDVKQLMKSRMMLKVDAWHEQGRRRNDDNDNTMMKIEKNLEKWEIHRGGWGNEMTMTMMPIKIGTPRLIMLLCDAITCAHFTTVTWKKSKWMNQAQIKSCRELYLDKIDEYEWK